MADLIIMAWPIFKAQVVQTLAKDWRNQLSFGQMQLLQYYSVQ